MAYGEKNEIFFLSGERTAEDAGIRKRSGQEDANKASLFAGQFFGAWLRATLGAASRLDSAFKMQGSKFLGEGLRVGVS